MIALKDDGTYQLIHKDGEKVEVKLIGAMVSHALHIQEGNEHIHTIKLIAKEKKMMFASATRSEQTYDSLKEQRVQLPLQFYQQFCHMLKPHKYTHPHTHVAYIFTLAHKRQRQMLKNGGEE